MLWREDNRYFSFSCGEFAHVFTNEEIEEMPHKFWSWNMNGGRELYQSFLLDYIAYLFESAIDRQLAKEEYPDELGSVSFHNHTFNIEGTPILVIPEVINA